MHILQICSSSSFNGETAHIYSLTRSLQDRGHQVTLGYRLRKQGIPLEIHPRLIEKYGIQSTLPLPIGKGFAPYENGQGLRLLFKFLKANPIQIVHCHRGGDHGLAGVLSPILGVWRTRPIRLVRTRHVTTPIHGHRFNQWLYEQCDLLLGTAKCICREIRTKFPELRTPVNLFHGGVDTQRYSPEVAPGLLRRELEIQPDDIVIACVGHLDPVKGYDLAIKALAGMGKIRDRCHLLIVGKSGGVSMNDLKTLARSQGIASRVHMLGFQENIPELLANCDIGLITSTGSEGNSRTALEMMASGLPIVSTSVGCLPDLLEEGVQGYLVPKGDIHELSQRLEQLAENSELRERMGAQGRRRALERYDNQVVVVEMEHYYESLLELKEG